MALLGVIKGRTGYWAWRLNSNGVVEVRNLDGSGRSTWKRCRIKDAPRTAEELRQLGRTGAGTYSTRRTARVFEDVDGYYVCNDSCDTLDTRGRAYNTKLEALMAAAESYTHATGSGTYWGNKVRSLDIYLQ